MIVVLSWLLHVPDPIGPMLTYAAADLCVGVLPTYAGGDCVSALFAQGRHTGLPVRPMRMPVRTLADL
ncbi:MAG: hypothetical protein M1434_05860, partial [Chloroflexi bacterium]|nr:hypothetical protein [Chloroflexota bacterium]